MERTLPKEFRRLFLLTFTRELIKQSIRVDITKLERIIESKGKKNLSINIPIPKVSEPSQLPKLLRSIVETPIVQRNLPILKRDSTKKISPVKTKRFTTRIKPLFIPEQRLPPHLEYLKPTPTPNVEIDLLKLNPLVKDPAVRIIEGNPDEKVIVSGAMGTKPTDITLNKEDIDRIINKFSEVSKIPTAEGIYKVVVGNFILSAIISEVIGSRFIIKKMSYSIPQRTQIILPAKNNFLRTYVKR